MEFEGSPIVSGLIGGVVATAIGWLVGRIKAPAPSEGITVLHYHGVVWGLVVVCGVILGAVVVAGWHQWPEATLIDRLAIVALGIGSPAGGLYLCVLGTQRLSLDDLAVTRTNIWGSLRLPWNEVKRLKYNRFTQTFHIVSDHGTISANNYLIGFATLVNETASRTNLPLPQGLEP